MLLVVAVRYELFCSDPVAVFKQPLQAAAGVGACEEFAKPTQRKFVLTIVFEPTGMLRFRNKSVRMFPLREGSGAHDIFEHAVGFDGHVFGDPVLREGADPSRRVTWEPGLSILPVLETTCTFSHGGVSRSRVRGA